MTKNNELRRRVAWAIANALGDPLHAHSPGMLAAADAALLAAGVPLPGYVKMPTSPDEARAMWLLGEKWIRANAPEMLKQDTSLTTTADAVIQSSAEAQEAASE